jgi:hypothetical protein
MYTNILLGLLICLSASQSPKHIDSYRYEDYRNTCILYTTLNDCSSCRYAFSDFALRHKRSGCRFRIALGYSRMNEYRSFIQTQPESSLYMPADPAFLSRFSRLATGDILLISNTGKVARFSLLNKDWSIKLENAIMKIE